jgi:hypothetical protein
VKNKQYLEHDSDGKEKVKHGVMNLLDRAPREVHDK